MDFNKVSDSVGTLAEWRQDLCEVLYGWYRATYPKM